jgi:hypothetical protein
LPAKDNTVLKLVTNIAKWASILALMIGAICSGLAATYEPMMNLIICLAAIGIVLWQARLRNYYYAAEFAAVGLVFSPLPLVEKIFFLMGLMCLVSFRVMIAAFRMQPAPAI